ncbi:hypothetical protein LX77_00093 [Gelidibacter algens]|jgi:hypothetical protein|uniref:Uncharacterized protein n=1 Tax=Gelidibacter algens TaxID=49280 RepID=A0A1A7QQJ6_9FLAO|nr:hypothetical protein [Gelidibacter algens]OBX21776.1 hypothetical protein A9996_17690 [Gelidibacter algens]RAJ27521.1 hypothetical protein LX77_00093 [Gelidibacter algens]
MLAKLVKISCLMLILNAAPSYAQSKDAMEKEREKYMEKQMDQYRDRVDTYVKLLNIDDFKGEIIKQKIDDFYKKRNQIMFSELHQEYEKVPMVEQLSISHFSDVKELYSEETIASVQRFVEDNKAEIKKLQKTKNKKNN